MPKHWGGFPTALSTLGIERRYKMVKCGALDFVLVDVGLLAVLLCGRGWGYARGCLVVTRAEGASFSVINFEQNVLGLDQSMP